MGTSAGPSLAGIGRGGASNLVLEMDAHDAKSYPGEPTSNIVPNPNFIGGSLTGWSKYTSDVVFTAIADSDNPVNSPYIVKIQKGSGNHDVWAPLINKTFQGGNYTFSAWFKGEGTARLAKYDNNSGYVYGSWVTLTGDWQLTTMNATFNGSDSTSRCDFFICSALGSGGGTATPTLYVCGPQCEKKAYATPYVWDGYNGRPATTNLMIHGNVGTGQSFSDSSPSKHTITANGHVTHSVTQSKFSGGSIYFDGNGDYLSVTDSSDWSFGSGDFTVDAWINLANISTYHVIAAQDDNNVQKSWQFRTNVTTGDLLFRYSTNGTNETDFTATSGISINTWHHVAVCRYGSSGMGNIARQL